MVAIYHRKIQSWYSENIFRPNTLIVDTFLYLIFKLLFRSAWNCFNTEDWILCIWAKSRQKHMIDFHLAFWQTPPFLPLFLVLIQLWCAGYDQHLGTVNATYLFTSCSVKLGYESVLFTTQQAPVQSALTLTDGSQYLKTVSRLQTKIKTLQFCSFVNFHSSGWQSMCLSLRSTLIHTN